MAAAVAAFGRLDILVVNHGIWPAEDMPISEMTDEQWRRTMAVNLDSVFGLVQAAVAQMEQQQPPPVGRRGQGAYCADQLDGRAAGRGVPRRLCRDAKAH